jgi:hypothetical protein
MNGVQRFGLWNTWRTASVLWLVCLAACGGGGGGGGGGGTGGDPAPGPDLSGRRFLPLQVAYRWIYDDTELARSVIVQITGTRTVGGATGYVQQSDDPEDEESVFVEDAQGVRQFPGQGASTLSQAVGALQLLRYPLRVGDTHVVADRQMNALLDLDFDGRADDFNLRADATVIGLEAQDIPVGRVADCLHLRTTAVLRVRLSASGQTVSITTVSDDWFAPGVGRVRSDIATRGDGVSPSTVTQRLTAYGLGSVRSESVPPTASAPALSVGAVLGRQAVIRVNFSEDMDVSTLATALQVSDSNGRVLTGDTAVTARSIDFSVPAGWASGSYVARLGTTAQDQVGNALASAQSWNFSIDASAPTLVSSSPIEGTVDVPLASSIVLRFNEPVDPATVNATTVLALYDGALLTPMNYSVDGAVVTLTPRTALARGKPYSIRIEGVTDLLGNAISGALVGFRTDPGRFGAFEALLPAAGMPADTAVGLPVAVGDLDGDGRPDIVAATTVFDGTAWRTGLLRYRQQADGTRVADAPITLPASCQAAALAIGDVDGDGLNDLVVAQYDCGIRIYRQTAAGELTEWAVLDSPSSARMQLADLDGDGRPDIVAFGGRDKVLRIWGNTPTGFVLRQTVTIDASFGSAVRPDLAVGDLDGDGRPDIVVTSDSLPGFAAAALIKQNGDGSFAAPQWLFTGDNSTAGSLAIGDIDGDGRPDLVVGPTLGLMVFSQRSDGQLAPARRISDQLFPAAVTLADVNGDGRLDILAAVNVSDFEVRLQQADGTLAPPASYPDVFRGAGLAPGGIVVADVDGDGRVDVLVAGHLFLQRPVPVMSQSLRPAAAGGRHRVLDLLRQAAQAPRSR